MTKSIPMNRRQLLASAAAASTVALTGSRALNAQPSSGKNNRPLKLGLMSYNLAKDWDIDTIIKNCTETGFEHIELRTTHAHGIEGTKEYTLLARDLGALGIRVFPNALPAGVPEEQTLRQIGKSLGEVGEFGHDHGVDIRVCVHGSGTNIVAKIKKMIDYAQSPHVYINWNCDHNDTKGPGFEANFNSVKDRIRNIHMHELWDEQYPYREFFRLLKQAGYQGYCDAEIPASCEPIRLMKYYRALFLAYQNAI